MHSHWTIVGLTLGLLQAPLCLNGLVFVRNNWSLADLHVLIWNRQYNHYVVLHRLDSMFYHSNCAIEKPHQMAAEVEGSSPCMTFTHTQSHTHSHIHTYTQCVYSHRSTGHTYYGNADVCKDSLPTKHPLTNFSDHINTHGLLLLLWWPVVMPTVKSHSTIDPAVRIPIRLGTDGPKRIWYTAFL